MAEDPTVTRRNFLAGAPAAAAVAVTGAPMAAAAATALSSAQLLPILMGALRKEWENALESIGVQDFSLAEKLLGNASKIASITSDSYEFNTLGAEALSQNYEATIRRLLSLDLRTELGSERPLYQLEKELSGLQDFLSATQDMPADIKISDLTSNATQAVLTNSLPSLEIKDAGGTKLGMSTSAYLALKAKVEAMERIFGKDASFADINERIHHSLRNTATKIITNPLEPSEFDWNQKDPLRNIVDRISSALNRSARAAKIDTDDYDPLSEDLREVLYDLQETRFEECRDILARRQKQAETPEEHAAPEKAQPTNTVNADSAEKARRMVAQLKALGGADAPEDYIQEMRAAL